MLKITTTLYHTDGIIPPGKDTMRNTYEKQIKLIITILMIVLSCCTFSACSLPGSSDNNSDDQKTELKKHAEKNDNRSPAQITAGGQISLEEIPEWDGSPSAEINDNEPEFKDEQLQERTDLRDDKLSSLDSLGRCGDALTCVSTDTMPEGERGSIGMIRPSGWQIEKYDFVDGKYLYNRCHLIGWQLTGQRAEEKNLITGTRYMNTEGMLPFENKIAEYVEDTGNRVAYHVEPVFEGDELVARGVHMEAESIEDEGAGISFNVFCYNVQPNIEIDYMTGESELAADNETNSNTDEDSKREYVLNTNTKRYHLPGCKSLSQMKDKNKETFRGSKSDLDKMGYRPCGNCEP